MAKSKLVRKSTSVDPSLVAAIVAALQSQSSPAIVASPVKVGPRVATIGRITLVPDGDSRSGLTRYKGTAIVDGLRIFIRAYDDIA